MKNFLTQLRNDGRHFQIIAQFTFILIGSYSLSWELSPIKLFAILLPALGIQWIAILFKLAPNHSLKSALVTSLGLILLFRSDSIWMYALAASLAIGQKFIFRYNNQHFFNPANFGIIATMVLTNNAWISPAQWGTNALMVGVILSFGLAVLIRISRVDMALTFLITYLGLEYVRTIMYLNWNLEVYIHKISQGSIWLFALFMLTDPMTSPNKRSVRIVWTILIASASFYLTNFKFVNGSPLWVLVCATWLVPFINKITQSPNMNWILTSKTISMKTKTITVSALTILAIVIFSLTSSAFCGFYVAKADGSLFNNKSEVILVRDGNRNVITMSSDYQGDMKDFAMVVPVPVAITKDNVRVINRSVFQVLDNYSSPRLVEYYDQNPCGQYYYDLNMAIPTSTTMTFNMDIAEKESTARTYNVTIVDSYSVGEYDIIILSAKESGGLKEYLIHEGYKIPATAEKVLEPYIKSNMKFFLVKVNLDKQKESGTNELSPIQISFDHEKFMLPIRLGMANSKGEQDMIVYAFTKRGRVECTNYRTAKIPTDRNVPEYMPEIFGDFYKNLFTRAYSREGKNAVFLEYAWNVTPSWGGMKCDPCVGNPPIYGDFANAGVWWANSPGESVFFTRLHVRYSPEHFPSDLSFQITANNDQFQARYIIHHPAYGPFDCEEAQSYLSELYNRRKLELDEMYALSGIKPGEKGKKYLFQFIDQMNEKPLEYLLQGALPLQKQKIEEQAASAPEVDMAYVQGEAPGAMDDPQQRKPWEIPIVLGSVIGGVYFVSRKKTT